MKKKMAAGLAVCLIGAGALVSSLTVAQQNEYQLVRQFGKVKRIIAEPGIYFKIPFVESASTLPKETLIYDLIPSDVITKDKKTMICDSYVCSEPLPAAQRSPPLCPDPEFICQQCGEQVEHQCIQCHQECDQQYGSGSGHQRKDRKPFRKGDGKHRNQHGAVWY